MGQAAREQGRVPAEPVAALRQRVFVEIREPLRAYPTPTQPFDGRDFPLSTVEILTKRTPNLLPFDPAKGDSKETFLPLGSRSEGPGLFGNDDGDDAHDRALLD